MGGDFFQGVCVCVCVCVLGGGGVALILLFCEGAYLTHFPTPLHVIIAQSLNLLFHGSPLICTSIVCRDRGIVRWQSLLFSQLIKNNLQIGAGSKKTKFERM